MVLIVGAALAALTRGLMNHFLDPNTTYENSRALMRISRGSGRAAMHARMALRGFVRGGIDEFQRIIYGAPDEVAPLLREFEMVDQSGMYVARSYATAEEGFAAGIEAEAASVTWIAPFLAAAAAGAGALEAEHHRHGIGHDLIHPIDALEDVWHGIERAVEFIATGKRKTPEPESPATDGDDFSGIQYTFYDPPTGRIIGYKGIRRFGKRLSKKTTGKRGNFGTFDLDSARPVSRIRPE